MRRLAAALALALAAAAARADVKIGAQVLVESGYAALDGCTAVGVVTNPTGVLPSYEHEVDHFVADPAIASRIAAVFGPEHGFRGAVQDGKPGSSYRDPQTNLTVWTTYGKSGRDLAALLVRSGVDCIAVDLQDVGARFYTYIWTTFDTMVAAALAGTVKRLVVLDRPNPIGGDRVSGPMLDPAFSSFVGRVPIPLRHGMTLGELASLFQGEYVPAALPAGTAPVPLRVVAAVGYLRNMSFADTAAPWVAPSPNMPTLDTAAVYPGFGLWEGTNASTGRGTTRPFETVGAAYFDWRYPVALRRAAASPAAGFRPWAGMLAREAFFIPTFDRFQGRLCAGFQSVVTDPGSADPIAASLDAIATALRMYPANMTLTPYLDLLTGSNRTRLALLRGDAVADIVRGFARELQPFLPTRQRYLLYP